MEVADWKVDRDRGHRRCRRLLQAQDAPKPAEPKVSFSGYIQPRYDRFTAERRDHRHRVPSPRGVRGQGAESAPSWNAELQIDAGPPASSGERLLVKDAVLRYTGWDPPV